MKMPFSSEKSSKYVNVIYVDEILGVDLNLFQKLCEFCDYTLFKLKVKNISESFEKLHIVR